MDRLTRLIFGRGPIALLGHMSLVLLFFVSCVSLVTEFSAARLRNRELSEEPGQRAEGRARSFLWPIPNILWASQMGFYVLVTLLASEFFASSPGVRNPELTTLSVLILLMPEICCYLVYLLSRKGLGLCSWREFFNALFFGAVVSADVVTLALLWPQVTYLY